MRKTLRFVLLLVLLIGGLAATPARAQSTLATPGACQAGLLPHGARSLICVPANGWNGDLILWGHGYVAFNQPLDFYNLLLPDGTYLPDLVQSLGFAFATTSYRQNGLAILEGVEDVGELVAAFPGVAGRAPKRTYMTGASEGGIIATLAIERHPELYTAGLGACGPIGNFREQLNYWGDFRVLFDYFFPGILPGSPIQIPASVIANWDSTYVPAITAALAANPSAARQLINTSKAPIDPANPATVVETTISLLWYNVHATNDGVQKLGGSPYDNRFRVYFGSSNDFRLNLNVKRFSASAAALAQVQKYETSGNLTKPLVTLHTTGDQIIPYWHELLYPLKVHTSGKGSLTPIPAFRYGHCNFTTTEVLAAFGIMILLGSGTQAQGISQQISLDQAHRDFARTQREFGDARELRERIEHEHAAGQ